MRIAIGADHAGFALKQHLVATLTRLGHQIDDHGTDSVEPFDYPEICAGVARAVVEQRADRGIVIGGSGQGEQMAANKVRGTRAALCNDLYTARLSRQHNDANVLALGAKFANTAAIAETFLTARCTEERHARRVGKIKAIEESYLK